MNLAWKLLPFATLETLYMVFVSAFFAFLIGLPLGIVLMLSNNRLLGWIVNIGRSFPFAILMVALIPFTRFIVGTSLGTTAAIVPLSIAAAPFVARLVESALREIDKQLIETAVVMGSTTWQLITKVLLPEALPSLISGATLTVIYLIGYSTMAGLVGGGGLGKVAIQYGYNLFNGFIMTSTVILLILLVQLVQGVGNALVKRIKQKRGIL